MQYSAKCEKAWGRPKSFLLGNTLKERRATETGKDRVAVMLLADVGLRSDRWALTCVFSPDWFRGRCWGLQRIRICSNAWHSWKAPGQSLKPSICNAILTLSGTRSDLTGERRRALQPCSHFRPQTNAWRVPGQPSLTNWLQILVFLWPPQVQ